MGAGTMTAAPRMRVRGPLGKALLATALAIGLTPVLGADPAYACSCVAQTRKQHFKDADVVFKGKLIRSVGKVDGEGNTGIEKVTYIFKQNRAYKGKVRFRQKVRTSGSSASCGLRLATGKTYLVYAQRPEPGKDTVAARKRAAKKPLLIDLCGGTRKVKSADRSPADPSGTFVLNQF